ncbi:hypothetical protein BDV96DRAFT_148517 [Lophiotrema nucula]|uniref:F-box domain-containing protein n=1 Tax=Lophiotrema nucula TaxID=690887 RepID=A0A6A5Z1V8_9PLEO|nr:hypothetical protein BDV96DRAFT_148517 [Lophiotrema nucula]
MTFPTWNKHTIDEYARFYHELPPWKRGHGPRPKPDAPALPLPHPRLLRVNDLSKDLWLLVLEQLPISSLRTSVSPVCRAFHDLCMSILYRNIDISLHDYKINDEFGSYGHEKAWMAHHCPERTGRQHCRFIRQILKRPAYTAHIRSFTWTMDVVHVVRYDFSIENECRQMSDQIRLFTLLQNVASVDIDGGRAAFPIMPQTGPSLFPNAQHIRLGGMMPWSLVSAILLGKDKRPLKTLMLNNLIEAGRLLSWAPFAQRHHPRFRGPPTTHPGDVEEIWPEGSSPNQVRPGCMRRVLTAGLVARCRNLNQLVLRKQGQQHVQQELPSALTYEDEVYREWASFIAQVQPRHFRLEHGGSTLFPWNGGKEFRSDPKITLPSDVSPMDERFRDIIAPILAHGWSRLQSLEIQGVCATITAPILNSLHSRYSSMDITCDPNVTWCWNAEVSPSRITDEYILPPQPNQPLAVLVPQGRMQMAQQFGSLDQADKEEYWKEQDRMSQFLYEEGLLSKKDMNKRLAPTWRKVDFA